MRIIQEITIATLLDGPVELPTHTSTRKNCHFKGSCINNFSLTSLWDVYDEEQTLRKLREAGVSVNDKSDPNVTKIGKVRASWPLAASRMTALNVTYRHACKNAATCFFISKMRGCCLKLVPDTNKSVELLKKVNSAFQSAQTFKDEAAKVIDLFKKKTRQDLVITMHWRLDEDFIESKDHELSPPEYCEGMLGGLELLLNRTLSHHTTTTTTRLTNLVHVIVLGAFEVRKVKTFLDSCSMKRNSHPIGRLYEFHSKETLLSKSDSTILSDVRTDVKGQLDFELGLISDIFLGSPFSSFSVLIAFYRYSSPNYNPVQTIMAEVDVKDHLGQLFSIQYPYTHALAGDKRKCIATVNVFPPSRQSLLPCVQREKRLKD